MLSMYIVYNNNNNTNSYAVCMLDQEAIDNLQRQNELNADNIQEASSRLIEDINTILQNGGVQQKVVNQEQIQPQPIKGALRFGASAKQFVPLTETERKVLEASRISLQYNQCIFNNSQESAYKENIACGGAVCAALVGTAGTIIAALIASGSIG